MAKYVEVASVEQLPPGRGTVVRVEDRDVALFNVGGTFYAIEDACLHHGMSLGTSKLEGTIVTCRGHGWKYDVTSGSTYPIPGTGVAAYAVKVDDGRIMVAIDEPLKPGA